MKDKHGKFCRWYVDLSETWLRFSGYVEGGLILVFEHDSDS